MQWNARGQLAAWRDPLESEVRWQYYLSGLPVSLTDRIGRIRRWHYDPRGNLLKLENGNGGEYRFTYDETGHPTSETRPDDTSRRMAWDARGFLTTLEENGRPAADGGIARRWQQFSHDDSGLLTGRTTRHAEYRFTHDLNGQVTRIRRTPTAEGVALGIESDEIAFARDAAGRQVSEAGVNGELSYEWDVLGNLTNLTLSGEQKLSWLFQGAEIYKITSKVKIGDVTFKKGDYFYLDNLHKDHYETFSSLDKSKGVFNIDGTYNERKSLKAAKRKGPGC